MSVMNCVHGSGLAIPCCLITAHCCAYAVVGPACLIARWVTLYAVTIAMLYQCALITVPLHRPCPVSPDIGVSVLPVQLFVVTVHVPPGL